MMALSSAQDANSSWDGEGMSLTYNEEDVGNYTLLHASPSHDE
jgi:hypothetical protein